MIIVYTSFGLYTLTIAVFLLQISTTLRPSFNDCTFHGWNFTPLAPSPLWDVSTVPVPWLRRRQRTTLGAAKRHKDRRPRDNHRLKKADGDGEHTSRSSFFWVVYDLARIQNAEKCFENKSSMPNGELLLWMLNLYVSGNGISINITQYQISTTSIIYDRPRGCQFVSRLIFLQESTETSMAHRDLFAHGVSKQIKREK